MAVSLVVQLDGYGSVFAHKGVLKAGLPGNYGSPDSKDPNKDPGLLFQR